MSEEILLSAAPSCTVFPLPESKKLRLGHSKTPLRDALVKEFKAFLLGKAPIFPEEDMEQRKKEYLAFLLGERAYV